MHRSTYKWALKKWTWAMQTMLFKGQLFPSWMGIYGCRWPTTVVFAVKRGFSTKHGGRLTPLILSAPNPRSVQESTVQTLNKSKSDYYVCFFPIPVTRAKRSTPAKSACSIAITPAAPKSCSG